MRGTELCFQVLQLEQQEMLVNYWRVAKRLKGVSHRTAMWKSLFLHISSSSFPLFSSCLLCLIVKQVNWVSTETSVSVHLPLLPGPTKIRPVRAWEHNYNISTGFDLMCTMIFFIKYICNRGGPTGNQSHEDNNNVSCIHNTNWSLSFYRCAVFVVI